MPFRLRHREARFGAQLTALAAHLVTGAQLLAEILGSEKGSRAGIAARMREVDQGAETATHAVLRELSAAFVTPIDRVDVYRLAWGLRLCSRAMDDVADCIQLYPLAVLPDGMIEQVQYIGHAADLTAEAMPQLTRLRIMSETWIELTRLSKQSAEVHRRAVAKLTSSSPDVLQALALIRVEDGLQHTMAAFEGVAHVLEQIVVKES